MPMHAAAFELHTGTARKWRLILPAVRGEAQDAVLYFRWE